MIAEIHKVREDLARIGMIKLTRLDGERFVLNAELIRYVEQRPDTFITLTTGERFVVAETLDQVVDLAVDYQQRKHLMPTLSLAYGSPNQFTSHEQTQP